MIGEWVFAQKRSFPQPFDYHMVISPLNYRFKNSHMIRIRTNIRLQTANTRTRARRNIINRWPANFKVIESN